jgi:hypothetical protein
MNDNPTEDPLRSHRDFYNALCVEVARNKVQSEDFDDALKKIDEHLQLIEDVID